MTAKPFIVALIFGAAAALFVYRDQAAARLQSASTSWTGLRDGQVHSTITLLVGLGLGFMLSD